MVPPTSFTNTEAPHSCSTGLPSAYGIVPTRVTLTSPDRSFPTLESSLLAQRTCLALSFLGSTDRNTEVHPRTHVQASSLLSPSHRAEAPLLVALASISSLSRSPNRHITLAANPKHGSSLPIKPLVWFQRAPKPLLCFTSKATLLWPAESGGMQNG